MPQKRHAIQILDLHLPDIELHDFRHDPQISIGIAADLGKLLNAIVNASSER